jgi:hypothetical protein
VNSRARERVSTDDRRLRALNRRLTGAELRTVGGFTLSGAAEVATRASDAVAETSGEVAARADRLRARIKRAYPVRLGRSPPSLPLPAVPQLGFSLQPGETAGQLQELMRLVAQTTAVWLRRLMVAMRRRRWKTHPPLPRVGDDESKESADYLMVAEILPPGGAQGRAHRCH